MSALDALTSLVDVTAVSMTSPHTEIVMTRAPSSLSTVHAIADTGVPEAANYQCKLKLISFV